MVATSIWLIVLSNSEPPVTVKVPSIATFFVKLNNDEPSKSPLVSILPIIKSALAYPVPDKFTVVVGSASNPLNSLYLPVRASLNSPEYSVVLEGVYLP